MKYLSRLLLSSVLLAALAVAAGCSDVVSKQEQPVKQTTEAKETKQDSAGQKESMAKLVVYVPREDGRGVSPQTITVDKEKKTVKDAINLMIETDSRQSYPVFEGHTKAVSVSIQDDVATITMSKEFLTKAEGLTARLRLAAVVNTALAFEQLKGVRIRVNDELLTTYGGLDLSSPKGPMKDSIVK